MIFEVITPDEFRAFAEKSPYKSFMQTPEIAKLREKDGWVAYYLGVREDSTKSRSNISSALNADNAPSAETAPEQPSTLLAASLLAAKPTFLGKSTFLAPGGPLLDLENAPLATFFFKNLRNFIKSHNGFLLHIDPYYELIERDRSGALVEGGFNHQKALKTLKNLNFTSLKHSSQPKYLFALDLDGRTPDELLASFKRNTRNHIRKAEKQGVKIRTLEKADLKYLKSITEQTASRRDFTDKPLSYYESMYDLFAARNEAQFILAEAKIDGKMTPLSAAMFMTYGDEIVYLFSGSDEKYMRDYNAQYLIQWHMIQYAAKNGFKRYNFYGINGLPDPSSKDYGIYEFKKGFGGQVIELIGSFEQKITPLATLYDALKTLKNRGKK